MKKLLIILSCVAATVGLCAQDTFEDRTVGTFTDGVKDDTVWFVSATTEAEIVQETTDSGSNNYLQITDSPSDDPLYRAYSVTLEGSSGDYKPDSVSVPSAGIYFDAQVQFSVSDTLDQAAVDEYAKFAFFAYCDEDSGETNLVARAAFHTSVNNKEATNYFLNLPEGVVLNPDTWYRVTIKTIPLFSNYSGLYGYIVYLNGELLSYDEGVTCGTDEAFVNSLTATARKYYDSQDYGHSLLPGMTSSAQIDRVVFAGTGALDDVDWTTTAPDFAKDETIITLTWDDGVESLMFGEEEVDVSAAGTKEFTVAADTKTVTITATPKDGYALSSSWENGEKDTTAPTTYAVKTYAYQVTVDNTPYEKTADAVAAAIEKGKPLVLVKNLADQVYVETDGTLVIDLNGHDITVPEDPDYEVPILISAACNLIITNSSETLGTVYAIESSTYIGTYSVYTEDDGATVTVYENCKFEGDFYAYPVTCYGGIFKQTDETSEEFPYLANLPTGYEATLGTIAGSEGNYWTVAKETTKTPLEIFIAAIEAAEEGDTVKLTDNITLTDRIDIDINKAITIDLDGKTVKPTETCANGSAFNIVSGTITFKNGTIDGTAIIDADVTAGNKECDPITVRSGASVTLADTLVIKIKSKNGACVYVFNGGTAKITGGVYENLTTEAYDAKPGTDIVGLAVNQDSKATDQRIVITGGQFKQYDPAKGDDSGLCTTFLASGYKSVLGEDGFYTVEVKNTPKTWTDVDPNTQDLADVVADDQLEVIKAANITVSDLRTWATNYVSATTPGVDINIDALTLNCAPGEVETAKADFKATQEDLNAIVAADKEDKDVADILKKSYEEKYPNATVTVEKITADNATSALYSTDTLKLFRLKITLGRSE